MADKMSIDNKPNPPPRDDSEDSTASSPERDQINPPANTTAGNNASQDPVQQPKRKGGRKPPFHLPVDGPVVGDNDLIHLVHHPMSANSPNAPSTSDIVTLGVAVFIYATSEERKQRNRQAQAAFRERRTEYIKQLEEAIRAHETSLHSLQAAHRNAAEECLMLRYKNSLLERILLEKGIDVQAELQAKTGSPNLAPSHMPQNLVQPPPLQRTMMHRHHARKSMSSIAPKSEPGIALPTPLQPHKSGASPKSRPITSPLSNSPNLADSAFSPAPSDGVSVRRSISGIPRQQMGPMPVGPVVVGPRHSMMQAGTRAGSIGSGAAFYPTPSFQNHIEQLEQEYEAEMVDDSEIETPNGPGPFSSGFNGEQQPMMLSPVSTAAGHHLPPQPSQYPSMTQLLDQHADWDPFGLSASMAFPAQPFQFDQPSMR